MANALKTKWILFVKNASFESQRHRRLGSEAARVGCLGTSPAKWIPYKENPSIENYKLGKLA